MPMTVRIAGLLALSALTAGLTATALVSADGTLKHTSEPQVVLLREPLELATPVPAWPTPVALPTQAPPENPSALQVAGNPRRYIGSHIHWMCTIDIVPEPTFADAYCGPHVPRFVQPPLTADQMENDPDAVADSIRHAQGSLHGAIIALNRRALIILTGPVQDLDKTQVITIDGTVRRPIHGENAFGVTRAYPTVHVDSITQ